MKQNLLCNAVQHMIQMLQKPNYQVHPVDNEYEMPHIDLLSFLFPKIKKILILGNRRGIIMSKECLCL